MSVKIKTSKKQRVLNHLTKVKKITRKQAMSLYDVKNLRATISDLRNTTKKKIVTNYTKTGEVQYEMAN